MRRGVQILGIGLGVLLLAGCNLGETTQEDVGEVLEDEQGDKVSEGGELVYGITDRVKDSISNKEVPILVGDNLKIGKETIHISGVEILDTLEGIELPIQSTVGVKETKEEDINQYLKVNMNYELGEVGELTQALNSLLVVYGEVEVDANTEEDSEEEDIVKQVQPKRLVGIGFEDSKEVSEEDIYLKEGETFEGYVVHDLEGTNTEHLVAQFNTLSSGERLEFPLTGSEGEEIVRSIDKHGKLKE